MAMSMRPISSAPISSGPISAPIVAAAVPYTPWPQLAPLLAQ